MNELETVEETKHLVPNLPILAKALFGDNAYLLPKAPNQSDWATQDTKIGDGLLWLPWKRQLWLIEVEWKEGSNFFYQSRAFAEGKVDEEKLFNQLKNKLKNSYSILNKPMHMISEGIILENIVDQTLRNHIFNGYLKPHGWIVLGHGKDNQERLRQDYEKELKARFREDKHYILSLARMFYSEISSYILLEQYWSKGCQELISVRPSILIPATTAAIKDNEYSLKAEKEKAIVPIQTSKPSRIVLDSGFKGRAGEIWAKLKQIDPTISPDNVRLRIQIDEKNYHDFEPDWNHSGFEFMVFSKYGIHRKPSNAAKEVFGASILKKYGNIARKLGCFVDTSKSPSVKIANYRDIEKYLRLQKQNQDTESLNGESTLNLKNHVDYFEKIDTHKEIKIRDNILKRKRLWEVFLQKKQMKITEFYKLSDFKPKAIVGFFHFLKYNGIAERRRDTFILSDHAIPSIKQILEGKFFIKEKTANYFENIDAHKATKIRDNILNRKELWKLFIEKKTMTTSEFKSLSNFKPKAIAGFLAFLTNNGIAQRFADSFTLSEEVLDTIRNIIETGKIYQ